MSRLVMGPNAIHIQVRWDQEKQWLTNQIKFTDEELDVIIADWPTKCQVSVDDEDMSYLEVGPPSDVLKELELKNDFE